MADSACEDRNVERSHYHVQTQWLTALRDGVGLAGLTGDAASARRWKTTIDALQPEVNRRYWNEHERYFEETLRPDGSLDTSGKIAAQLTQMQLDNLGVDYIQRRTGMIDGVTIADAKRVAKRLYGGGLLVTVAGRPKGLTSGPIRN